MTRLERTEPARSGRCCHETASRRRGSSTSRRLLEGAGWMIPAGVLALLPKCPMCVAAYVAVGTGLTLSATSAGYLRLALLIACGGWLAVMALMLIGKVPPRRPRVRWDVSSETHRAN